MTRPPNTVKFLTESHKEPLGAARFIAARGDAGISLTPKFCSLSFNPRVSVLLSSKTLQLQGCKKTMKLRIKRICLSGRAEYQLKIIPS